MFKYYVSKISQILDPPPCFSIISTSLDPHPRLICWRNTWKEGELVDDFYDTFQIIKICFSINIMNIFWDVGAVFKKIRAWLRKNFISLLTISSILQQYLLYVSTISPLPFKVSACQHFGLDPHPTPPKHADVILERSLNTKSSV